jgi:hypothetical protein
MMNNHMAELRDAQLGSPHDRAAKSYSAFHAILKIGGFMLVVLPASFLAIHYILQPNAPTPISPLFSYGLLLLGLLLAAVGHRLTEGRWKGVAGYLHYALAGAGLVYLGAAAEFSMDGRPVHWYPAGILAVISGALVISRLLAKNRSKLYSIVGKRKVHPRTKRDSLPS